MPNTAMRQCPGNAGRPCGTYMSPLFRDPHPTCEKCRGRKCSYDTMCDICDGWSVKQWEHFNRKRSYAQRNKSSRHAGDPIETASNPPLSPASAKSISPLPTYLPPPPPSEGSGEGSEAPSVSNINSDNLNEPHVSSPTSMPSWGHGEGGRDTPKVGNGEREASPTSLASAGGREKPHRPQPDTLDEKVNSSPTKFRPNRPSTHHVDDWDENGAYRPPPPSPTSLHPRNKKKREERGRPIDQARAADFYEKSARRLSPHRARPRPHGRDRHVAPARPRSPPVRAAPAESSRIHWGLTHPYGAHTELGKPVARPRNEATRHNSVASSV